MVGPCEGLSRPGKRAAVESSDGPTSESSPRLCASLSPFCFLGGFRLGSEEDGPRRVLAQRRSGAEVGVGGNHVPSRRRQDRAAQRNRTIARMNTDRSVGSAFRFSVLWRRSRGYSLLVESYWLVLSDSSAPRTV